MTDTTTDSINICFFGLNRSLSTTYSSIQARLLDLALQRFDSVHIYACFLRLDAAYSNLRSGEESVCPEFDEQDILRTATFTYLHQDTVDSLVDWQRIFAFGDQFCDDRPGDSVIPPSGSVRNIVRSLHSLRSAYLLIPDERKIFPTLFLRPDLEPLEDLNMDLLVSALTFANSASRGTVLVPSWHSWGGVNDRLAFCTPGLAAEAYACRIDRLYDYLRLSTLPLHPESFLHAVLFLSRVSVLPLISAKFARIRSGGVVHHEPFHDGACVRDYPSEAWRSLVNLLSEEVKKSRQSLLDTESLRQVNDDLVAQIDRLQWELHEAKAIHSSETERLLGSIRQRLVAVRRDLESLSVQSDAL